MLTERTLARTDGRMDGRKHSRKDNLKTIPQPITVGGRGIKIIYIISLFWKIRLTYGTLDVTRLHFPALRLGPSVSMSCIFDWNSTLRCWTRLRKVLKVLAFHYFSLNRPAFEQKKVYDQVNDLLKTCRRPGLRFFSKNLIGDLQARFEQDRSNGM